MSPSGPPIWQGTARHGDYAEVLSRNPNGTFQVRIRGQEQTRTERDVAYMTGMNKPALDAHLEGVTDKIDNSKTPFFSARRGDRTNIIVPGELPHGQAGEFDRARLRDKSRELFSLLQAYAETYSPGSQRQGVSGLRGSHTPPTGNPSAIGAAFQPDGSITIEGSPLAWADALLRDNKENTQAALDQAQATLQEEMWHVAQLVGMRNDWANAGKPGSFVDWVHDRSNEIMESIGDAAAKAKPEDTARIKQALFATWELYFAGEGHGQTPDSVFRQLTSPVQRGRLVARGTFLAEFTRQLHQAGVRGQTTETAGLLGRLKAWVQQALDGLKQAYAMARGGAMGQPLKDLMDRTEAVLQGREVALPIQPGLLSGPGDAFLAPRGNDYSDSSTPGAAHSTSFSHLPGTTEKSVEVKLSNYLLNPTHPVGGAKAKWFREALGFRLETAAEMARQIRFDPSVAIKTKRTEFGQKFEQQIILHGVNGRMIEVKSAWIENTDGVIRLVSIIPTSKKSHD